MQGLWENYDCYKSVFIDASISSLQRNKANSWAQFEERALKAFWSAGDADLAAVVDQAV